MSGVVASQRLEARALMALGRWEEAAGPMSEAVGGQVCAPDVGAGVPVALPGPRRPRLSHGLL
ncbi:MAG: hypothetical protein ABSA91_19580, partial [Acidimicrobiales bacterium]